MRLLSFFCLLCALDGVVNELITVKLGQVTPQECPQQRDGAKLSVQLINALNDGQGFVVGSLPGNYVRFELVSEVLSSEGTEDYPVQHASTLQSLLGSHDPLFLIGTCSWSAEYEKQVVKESNKILMAQVGPDEYYSDDFPSIFGIHVSNKQYSSNALKMLSFEGARTVAIAGREASLFFRTTCESAEQYALEYGMELSMPRVTYPAEGTASKVNDKEFQRQLAKEIAESNPDVIVGCVGAPEADVWVETWVELEFQPKAVWLTCTTWGWPETLGMQGGNGSYMLGAGQWHPAMKYTDSLVGDTATFLRLFEEKFGYDATYDAVASYTIPFLYMRVMQRVYSNVHMYNLSSADIPYEIYHHTLLEGFSEPKTLFGPVTLDENRRNYGRHPSSSQFLPVNDSTDYLAHRCVAPLEVLDAQLVYPAPASVACSGDTSLDFSGKQCLLCSKCVECVTNRTCDSVVYIGQVVPDSCSQHRDGVGIAVQAINSQNGGKGFQVGYSELQDPYCGCFMKFEFISITHAPGAENLDNYSDVHSGVVQQIIDTYDPELFVGTCSFTADYEKETLNDANKIFMALVGPNAYYEGDHQYLFGMHISSYLYAEPVLKLISFEGARTVAIAGREASLFFRTTCESAEQYALEYGMELSMPRVTYPAEGTASQVNDRDYQRQLAKEIAQSNPDVIVGCVGAPEADVWVEMWVELEFQPKAVWLTCTTWGWPQSLGIQGGNGSYMMGGGQWHPDMTYSDPLVGDTASFMAMFDDMFGYTASYDAVASYTAALVYMLSIQKAFGSMTIQDPRALFKGDDYEDLRRSLESFTQRDTLFGPVSFDVFRRNTGRKPASTQFLVPTSSSTGEIRDMCISPLDVASAALVYPVPGFNPCPAGQSYNPSFGQCLLCGKCVDCQEDDSDCCPAGNYVDSVSELCLPCPVGTFNTKGGALECTSCDVLGGYQNEVGAIGCKECPEGSTRILGSEATSAESCWCKENYYTPTNSTGTECLSCPEGSVCMGGVQLPYPESGHWGDTLYPYSFEECAPKSVCVGGPGFECEGGYSKRMCAYCDSDYFNVGGTCFKCPEAHLVVELVGISLVVVLFVIMTRISVIFESMGMLLNFAQLVQLSSTIELRWPSVTQNIMDALAIVLFEVDYIQPQCALPWWNVIHAVWLQWLLNPVVLLLLFIYFRLAVISVRFLGANHKYPHFCKYFWKPCSKLLGLPSNDIELHNLLDSSISGFVMFSLGVFPVLTSRVVQAFFCVEREFGSSFLSALPEVSCGTTTHYVLMGGAAVAFLLYTITLPTLLFLHLRSFHRKNVLNDANVLTRYGFLYDKYRVDKYWFEAVHTVEKMVLVIVSQGVVDKPLIAAALQVLNIVAVMSLHMFFNPILDPAARFAIKIQYCALVIFVLSGMIYYYEDDSINSMVEAFNLMLLALVTLHSVHWMWLDYNLALTTRKISEAIRSKTSMSDKASQLVIPESFAHAFPKHTMLHYLKNASEEQISRFMRLGEKLNNELESTSIQSMFSRNTRAKSIRMLTEVFPGLLDVVCLSPSIESARLIGSLEMFLTMERYIEGAELVKRRIEIVNPNSRAGFVHWAMLAKHDDLQLLNQVLSDISAIDAQFTSSGILVGLQKSISGAFKMEQKAVSSDVLKCIPSPEKLYNLSKESVATILGLFDEVDKDGNGVITANELMLVLDELHHDDWTLEDVKDLMAKFDSNGSPSMINRVEFVRLLCHNFESCGLSNEMLKQVDFMLSTSGQSKRALQAIFGMRNRRVAGSERTLNRRMSLRVFRDPNKLAGTALHETQDMIEGMIREESALSAVMEGIEIPDIEIVELNGHLDTADDGFVHWTNPIANVSTNPAS
eukprot:CAMPEP_0196598576 /NCGR_PEP_ID=MMETSP1081-20130531/94395_1 /TAXON_ID=36882 /ORGANISM="Pyramimonas amylifera, Strain CCMP720" /LENGTH=1848 /DNA_ID=CAMNT_0041924287 /DNA_START=314 /DNA_END=5860 /DNA_ORIENTATION=-